MGDYTAGDITQALRSTGLEAGSIVFCHSNIGFLGRPQGQPSAENSCSTVLQGLQDCLGKTGTMVVPTYTYSLPRGETFDPVSDGTLNCGLLSEYVLDHPESLRSLDPCISCAAIGPAAEELFSGLPEYAYGKDCMWQRLHERGAVLCSINLGAGSTFLHWVEGQLGVPYRFEKQFTGQMRVDGELSTVRSTLLVRYLDSDLLEADFAPFTEQARRTGLYRTALVGRGRIGIIAFADMYDLVEQTLPQRPWFLTAAERHDTKPMPPFTQR